MRLIVLTIFTLFLAIIGWALFGFHDSAAAVRSPSEWRRTVNGWERKEAWLRPVQVTTKALHPLTVGGFQLVASLGVLVAFSNDRIVG